MKEKWQHLQNRLKELVTKYGPIALVVHFTLFGLVLAGFYAAISLGFKVDSAAESTGTFAAAYVATQLTKPLRFLAVLALTPPVAALVNRLRGKKPPEP